MSLRKYGWKKQKEDYRDFKLELPTKVYIPVKYDLSEIHKYPAPYDQGQLGSCTSNAIVGALQADQIAQKLPTTMLSRLFVYYYERFLEGDVSTDGGAEIRDGMKVVNTYGVCAETEWPYIETQFAVKPSLLAQSDAKNFTAVKYATVNQDLKSLQTAILAGFPIVFGITVYESFESNAAAASGVITYPNVKTEQLLGGHAILIVGYDNRYKAFKFRNSWGTSWGSGGYGFIPYKYVLDANLASDFWTVTQVS